jgi:hypothetical protein
MSKDKKQPKLNKPFRTPSGPKKFGVYVKNDKGNIVLVRFGDPNMEIKRDDKDRRKSFRARHGCDNPGPKWKAKYWSCRMWSAKPVSEITSSVLSKTKDPFQSIIISDLEFSNPELWPTQETLYPNGLPEFEIEEIEAAGLWENIRNKKAREGKNYRPAKPGDKDRPSKKAWEKAQAGFPVAQYEPLPCDCESVENRECPCESRADYLLDEINRLWSFIYSHDEGHLPKFKSTEQLKNAIKILGLEDEYEVVPERIYASDGRLEREEFVFRKK